MSEPLAPRQGSEPEEIKQSPPSTVASRLAMLAARRRDHRPGADGAAGLPDRRPARAGDRAQPDPGLLGHRQRRRPELARPPDEHRRRQHRRLQLQPDAAADDAADPDRPRRRLRLPLRDVQHRRQRPVPGRPLRRELDRHLLRPPDEAGPHPARGRRRRRRGRDLGGDRRLPEGDHRRPRGDHDDHAQLDRLLDRQLHLPAGRPAAGRRRTSRWTSRSPATSPRARSCPSSGATPTSRACTSASSSRSARWSSSG